MALLRLDARTAPITSSLESSFTAEGCARLWPTVFFFFCAEGARIQRFSMLYTGQEAM